MKKTTPLDPIVKAGLHFGSDEPVEDEHAKALSAYKYAHVQLNTPAVHLDPFTCHIQETVAMVVFGANIPKEKPTEGNATKELLLDVEFYQRASERSQYFEKNLLGPKVAELYEFMMARIKKSGSHQLYAFHEALKANTELIVEPTVDKADSKRQSIWSCQRIGSFGRRLVLVDSNGLALCKVFATAEEATLLMALHNNYHFHRYLCAIVESAIKAKVVAKIQGFVHLWNGLTGECATLPVREWGKKKRLYFTGPIQDMFEARKISILILRL